MQRVQMVLTVCAHEQAARTLLTLDDKETKRLFEGEALLRRMYKYGLLEESQNKLDYVLALTPQVRTSLRPLCLPHAHSSGYPLVHSYVLHCVAALCILSKTSMRGCGCM